MSLRVIETREAIADVIQAADYIADTSSLNASESFLNASKRTYRQLADNPRLGVLRDYDNPEYAGMRMWHMLGYKKYLVFYIVLGEELKIMRVLHGARDIQANLRPKRKIKTSSSR